MFTITPTLAQSEALSGPKTIESLLAADFLGNQRYIDEWIYDWFERNDHDPDKLPLCVSESLMCYKKLMRRFVKRARRAAVENDCRWLSAHCIVAVNVWSFVEFHTVSNNTFDVLWSICPVPLRYCWCIVESRRMHMWRPFVDTYGPDCTMRDALQSFWVDGVKYCLYQGANLEKEDYVKLCIRCPEVFTLITDCNPPATAEAYEEYLLQKLLRRVPDIPLVEQWFWINGFKRK